MDSVISNSGLCYLGGDPTLAMVHSEQGRIAGEMSSTLQMAQLLCTRLCHDLAGPIGAVSAGVELMGTDPSLIDDETLALLSGSAEAASRKLKFLRIAFGWTGSGSSPLDQVGGAFEDYLISMSGPSGGPTLTWPNQSDLELLTQRLAEEAAQVLANIALIGFEVQPGCRSLTIEVAAQGNRTSVSVLNKPSRDSIKIRDDIKRATEDAEDISLTPQTIQAHLARQLISKTGGKFVIGTSPNGALTTVEWQ